jgi:hypothetical protein
MMVVDPRDVWCLRVMAERAFVRLVQRRADDASMDYGFQHDFNASIFLITEGLVSGWRFFKRKTKSDDNDGSI